MSKVCTVLAGCTLFVSFALSQTPQQLTVSEVVKRASDAVVQIVVSDEANQEMALGSGFLVSADGQIVTNQHVIKNARSAIAKLANGSFFPVAGVVALDPEKDLAVLKVAGKNLPFLSLADSQALKVGDHVVAIGSPLGLEGTVSDGIVSALREGTPASHGSRPLRPSRTETVGDLSWIWMATSWG